MRSRGGSPTSLDAAIELAPFARPVRLGVVAIPAKGPSRFFGGEPAFAEHARAHARPARRRGAPVRVGIAEGLFAGMLAARSSVLVAAGATTGVPRSVVHRHAARPRPRGGMRAARPADPRAVREAGGGTGARALRARRRAAPPRRARGSTVSSPGSATTSRCAVSTRCGAATRRATSSAASSASRRCRPPRRGRRPAPREPARRRGGDRGAAGRRARPRRPRRARAVGKPRRAARRDVTRRAVAGTAPRAVAGLDPVAHAARRAARRAGCPRRRRRTGLLSARPSRARVRAGRGRAGSSRTAGRGRWPSDGGAVSRRRAHLQVLSMTGSRCCSARSGPDGG